MVSGRGDGDGVPEGVSLAFLDWDTQHFGFPVARLEGSLENVPAVEAQLARAREQGAGLVYALTKQPWDAAWAASLDGLRAGGHAVYERALSGDEEPPASAAGVVFERVSAPTNDADALALRDLGVAAGQHSRFRTDPRLPAERCDALYETWIRKSVTGEMADEVLVARVDSQLAALVTIKKDGSARGSIGLVAAAEAYRGRGLASATLRFAHTRLALLGIKHVEVVTQTENHAACGLYGRCGYELASQGHHYHFRFES